MKFKLYFILIIILMLLLPTNLCFAKQIKKIEDMTSNELIDYGRQLEKEETERNEAKQQLELEANRKFNDNIKKEQYSKYIPISIVCIFIAIIVIYILLIHKKQAINRL